MRASQRLTQDQANFNTTMKTNELPGYGSLPRVISSYNKIPYDQTSDFTENFCRRAASGAVHLIGNLAPKEEKRG